MVQNKRVRGALGIAALSVVVGCNESTPAPEANKPAEAAHTAALENGQNIVAKDAAGIPQFITGNLAPAPEIPAEGASSLTRDALASVVASVAPQFHLAPADLVFKKGYTDAQGDSHFRYDVVRNDIAVFGGEFRLHVRAGQVIAANTNVRSDLKADAKPTISSEEAVSSAGSDREALEGFVTSPDTQLVYFRDGDELRLMYKVLQTGEKADGTPVRDILLVDARTGDVQLRIPQIKEVLARRMHNGNNTSTLPGTVVRTEGQAPVADPVVNTNYNHLGTVYSCYNTLFGRDSINNAGALLISTVHHRVNYVNAFWDGTQMVYGDGDGVNASNLANSLDVTAHELTHAVTENESDLIYSGESGGLNESLSDIFGAVCEWYGDGRGPISPRYWIVGDDVWTPSIPNDGLRYMNNPTLDGDSLDYYPDYSSGVDVHYSSGISNLAFYLLSEGGTHPRGKRPDVVTGIGIEKAARIFYKANADLLLPSSNFEAAKTATEQAAAQLGYDAATIASVTSAWKAVGVGVPIPPPPTDPLEKDVPITGISGTSGSQKFFKVTVPEGAYDLTFTLAGGTGDADLYVRYNNAPTTTSYDCRPYRSGNSETCSFAAPSHGDWYVMLRGFSAYSNTSLTVTWKGGYIPVTSGVPYKYFSGAQGSSTVFTIVVPERKPGSGKNSLYVQTGEGYGNPDVYVKLGSAPTKSDYDCRSVKEHMSETCNLLNVPAGKYYIEVFGAKGGYEDIAFIASFLQ
ncbi:M4 family metallopeptidase [Pyxidicoccus parkwayensis]|uniref:M4 family metallopeptidase n=1 Tax=Pyxidicoccus parkwayensis TaxID=2813578 RepID=A0ABX7NYD1_9BACT|nr:M4 family metallopeptidase [Pyxidicoccus parkwaysis]QSQ23394.1 M4 family metallopeptidase [Pyxidicoccus parkwaysis]